MSKTWPAFAILLAVSGCNTPLNLPAKSDAYALIPPAPREPKLEEYRFQIYDRVNVTVYQEPDMSVDNVEISSAGSIVLPLVGAVPMLGRTAAEITADVSRRAKAYLLEPNVVVSLASTPNRTVTIEGAVIQPGVYPVSGPTTLLATLAMAHGPDRTAAVREVAVFRSIDGVPMGAKFDLTAIRRGDAANPQILPNDTVVVGLSNVRAAWRDILQASPFFLIFTRL